MLLAQGSLTAQTVTKNLIVAHPKQESTLHIMFTRRELNAEANSIGRVLLDKPLLNFRALCGIECPLTCSQRKRLAA
jgi:hypothetical protein